MNEIVIYQRFETGFTICDCYKNRKKICDIIVPVMPMNVDIPILYFINIIGQMQSWTCEINRQDTLFPGMVRKIIDRKTEDEQFRLVFEPYGKRWNNQMDWVLICDQGKKRIEVKDDGDYYVFLCDSKILLIIGRIADNDYDPVYNGKPVFEILVEGKMDMELLIAMISYPVLSR